MKVLAEIVPKLPAEKPNPFLQLKALKDQKRAKEAAEKEAAAKALTEETGKPPS